MNALAAKILFEGYPGSRNRVQADQDLAAQDREVILCGGAFNSPQLLQLSGVGPRALLERHGIPVVHDSPRVGENLQDHFYARTFWRCSRPITLNDDMASLWRQAGIGLKYLLFEARAP